VRGDYYRGMNFNNLILTRTDPQINFNWGDPGSPDPAVPVDQFSVRWTGEVEAGFTETYTFYPAPMMVHVCGLMASSLLISGSIRVQPNSVEALTWSPAIPTAWLWSTMRMAAAP